jgi:hypothetical protein
MSRLRSAARVPSKFFLLFALTDSGRKSIAYAIDAFLALLTNR